MEVLRDPVGTAPEPSSDARPRERRRVFGDYLRTLAIALPLALFLRVSIVEAYKIPSASMEDTILIGDRLIANKFVYGSRIPLLGLRTPPFRDPLPGDVIVFRSPTEPNVNFIKRCIAVGGQTVWIRHKQVFIDGAPVDLPRMGKIDPLLPLPGMDDFGPVVVPPHHLFVLGDNRDNSTDSRSWGFLDRDLVIGKAEMVYWSWNPDDGRSLWRRVRWNRIGDRIL